MAKQVSKEFIARYCGPNDYSDLTGSYKPGFDPAAVASPLVEKHGVQLISKVLGAPRSIGFEEFKAMGKEIMVGFVGETITKLSEGFVGGEEDCFKWIQFTM